MSESLPHHVVARPLETAGRAWMAIILLRTNTLLVLTLCGTVMQRGKVNFWRNSGGYSVGFRELVRVGFPVFP